MITLKDKSKVLTKVYQTCNYNFDGRKCTLNQKWNNNKCWSECKNPKEKYYILNPAKFSCENGKYAKSIIDNSVIMCDEIMKATNST